MNVHRSYVHKLSSCEIKGRGQLSVGRALYRYCKGNGFESRLNPAQFFQALFSYSL